jgi:hypothetical protein
MTYISILLDKLQNILSHGTNMTVGKTLKAWRKLQVFCFYLFSINFFQLVSLKSTTKVLNFVAQKTIAKCGDLAVLTYAQCIACGGEGCDIRARIDWARAFRRVADSLLTLVDGGGGAG